MKTGDSRSPFGATSRVWRVAKTFSHRLKRIYTRCLATIFYPGIQMHSRVSFWEYVFPQKVLNLNNSRRCRWPVHFTSTVVLPERIKAGVFTAPGRSPNCYIQATNGIELGDHIYIAPGVAIISANHDLMDLSKCKEAAPIQIGNNCWLGARSIILPGVTLGDGVVVGAGAVVSKSFPSRCVLVGVPAHAIRKIPEGGS